MMIEGGAQCSTFRRQLHKHTVFGVVDAAIAIAIPSGRLTVRLSH